MAIPMKPIPGVVTRQQMAAWPIKCLQCTHGKHEDCEKPTPKQKCGCTNAICHPPKKGRRRR